jgi:shikimate 5-dehydrogenase/3-dehydroquinate dehydratase
MLIVSINNLSCLSEELYSLSADLIELRLDLFPLQDLKILEQEAIGSKQALLVAIKPSLNKDINIKAILKNLNPAFIDLDYSLFLRFEPICKKLCPLAKIIVSKHTSHVFEIKKFYKRYNSADFKKLVIDTENVLLGLKIASIAQKHNYILFAGGINNSFTRFFSLWHYCYFKTPTAKGQYSLSTLHNLYSTKSRIGQFLALIGDPVCHSLSHITHNFILKTSNIPCVYLKIKLKNYELKAGLYYLKKLNCLGLSITTPHKENAFKILAKKTYSQSINSWLFENNSYTNTDILALKEALAVIEEKKSILLLGNGACSKSFQNFLKNSNIPYTIWSRQLRVSLQDKYDVIINATSSENPLDHLPKTTLLINLFHHKDHPKIEQRAENDQAMIFGGKQFFIAQASKQLEFFFQKTFHLDKDHLLSLVKHYKDR